MRTRHPSSPADPTSRACRLSKFDLACERVLRCEAAVDRLSAHLIFGPTEDLFGTGIPVGHARVEIERDDRVFRGAIEDLPQFHFLGANTGFGKMLVGGLRAGAEDARHVAVS